MRIFIDFETVDYGLHEGLGSGWAWGGVRVLGCAIKEEGKETVYYTDTKKIIEIATNASEIVAHNAQYEAGILHMLGVDIRKKIFYCTLLAAKVVNNTALSYSLNTLSGQYLGKGKKTDTLVDDAIKLGLVTPPKDYQDPATFKGAERTLKKYKTAFSRMSNLAMSQLDRIAVYTDSVAKYCIADVDLTEELFYKLIDRLDESEIEVYKRFCKLIVITTLMRAKGVRIDVAATYQLRASIEEELRPLEKKLWDATGVFNYNSPAQVKLWAYSKLGLQGAVDREGHESFGKAWVEDNEDHELVALYSRIKKLNKLASFCESIISYEKNGRVYPEMVIMEASTGRFSCRNPNIQQIPSRDEEYAPLMRSLFIPEKGDEWASLDFSSQEPRLQVHYAAELGSFSGMSLRDKYVAKPDMDVYLEVVDLVKKRKGITLTKDQSKILTLAMSYGMGSSKGAHALRMSVAEYKRLSKAYFDEASYVKDLSVYCQETIKKRGFLYTLAGRKSYNEPGFEYKALNKLIQGSALDQTAAAVIRCYEELGIVPISVIHDEINISCSDREVALKLKTIMETSIDITVPSYAKIGYGSSWGEAK